MGDATGKQKKMMMTKKKLTSLLEAATYHFAKTMPQFPHWYTLRRESEDESVFEAMVQAIRDYGETREWHTRKFVYFDAGQYTYWTMGSPISETTLINKAKRESPAKQP